MILLKKCNKIFKKNLGECKNMRKTVNNLILKNSTTARMTSDFQTLLINFINKANIMKIKQLRNNKNFIKMSMKRKKILNQKK